MPDVKISIITPSYNQGEFIADTLDSVKSQTYGNVEHLVMDGGSTDGTLDILNEYESDYDLTWVSESDEGQSEAINKGFDRASGDIVAWLNSDDVYLDVDALARVASYFARYEADVIYGDLAYIDQDSRVTAVDVRPPFDAEKLPYRILIGQPATFFRKRVVEEEKLDIGLDYSMDYEYWLRLAQRFSFRHVEDVLAGFRSYPEQKSQDQTAMAAELSDILTKYTDERERGVNTLISNITIETARYLRGINVTYSLRSDPPELAFDGEFAPLSTMLLNLGPDIEDAKKAFRRWRTGGASG